MKIINKIFTKITVFILITWLVIWFMPLVFSSLMIDILLRYMNVSPDLLLLTRLSKLLKDIGADFRNKNKSEKNQENETNE